MVAGWIKTESGDNGQKAEGLWPCGEDRELVLKVQDVWDMGNEGRNSVINSFMEM